jgi:hypothetical protein
MPGDCKSGWGPIHSDADHEHSRVHFNASASPAIKRIRHVGTDGGQDLSWPEDFHS